MSSNKPYGYVPRYDDGSQILNDLPDGTKTYSVDIVRAASTTQRVVVRCLMCDVDVVEVVAGMDALPLRRRIGRHHVVQPDKPNLRALRHLCTLALHCQGLASRLAPPELPKPPPPVNLPALPPMWSEQDREDALLDTAEAIVGGQADVRNAVAMAGVDLGAACAAKKFAGLFQGCVVYVVELRDETVLCRRRQSARCVLGDLTPVQKLCDASGVETHYWFQDVKTGRMTDLSLAVLTAGHGPRPSAEPILACRAAARHAAAPSRPIPTAELSRATEPSSESALAPSSHGRVRSVPLKMREAAAEVDEAESEEEEEEEESSEFEKESSSESESEKESSSESESEEEEEEEEEEEKPGVLGRFIVERSSRSSEMLRIYGPNSDLRWCGPNNPISNEANRTGQPWFSWQDPKNPDSDLSTAKQILDDVAHQHSRLRSACKEQWGRISSRGT